MFKTVTLKFKAKKNGVMLVRKYKYWIYRDKTATESQTMMKMAEQRLHHRDITQSLSL